MFPCIDLNSGAVETRRKCRFVFAFSFCYVGIDDRVLHQGLNFEVSALLATSFAFLKSLVGYSL